MFMKLIKKLMKTIGIKIEQVLFNNKRLSHRYEMEVNMAHSITRTSQILGISKFRLLKLLEAENIVAAKSGNKKLLSDDQIQQLKTALESMNQEQSDFFVKQVESQNTKSSTIIDLSVHQSIVKDLKDQIVYLQDQLSEEKRERSELSKGILAVQAQVFKVQQQLEVKTEVKRESFIQRMFSFQ